MKNVKCTAFAALLSAGILMLASCTNDRNNDSSSVPDTAISSDPGYVSSPDGVISDGEDIISSVEDFVSDLFSGDMSSETGTQSE